MHTVVDYCTEGHCLAGQFCPEESVEQRAFLDWTREDYGANIVADDNAYLLSTVQAATIVDDVDTGCPVHTGASDLPIIDNPWDPWFPDPSGGGGSGESSGGGVGGGAAEPEEPSPEDPSGGFGDENWFANLWNPGNEPKVP